MARLTPPRPKHSAPRRLILSDTSPLLGLSRVDGIPWLADLFGEVWITTEVSQELLATSAIEQPIRQALDAGWLQLLDPPNDLPPCPPHLGPGEWSTIQGALAHDGPCLLLMDDRTARREAQSMGLAVTGTAAVIGMAQKRGVIPSARDVFEQLLQSDFRIAPKILREILLELEEK
ncbi:MAG: DUF3368 domain-containing protein [Acidobacteriota bacterium]|nr:DUF3368 domain-containing protein [Acidobacteriota bacterium]